MQIPKLAIAALSAMALSMLSLPAQAGPIVLNGDFSSYSSGGLFYGGTSGMSATGWTLYPGSGTYTGGPLGFILQSVNDKNVAPFGIQSLEGGPYAGDGTDPDFVAIDGSCCNTSTNPTLGPLSQVLALTGGQTYVLSFDYAAAQLLNASGNTCEQWVVTIGGSVSGSASTLAEPTCTSNTSLPAGSTTNAYVVTGYLDQWTTPLLSIPVASVDFSGWYTETVTFTVPGTGPTNELLGFFAEGAPIGVPGLDLLDNVSVAASPEPATYGLIGAGLLGVLAVRRRLKKRC